MNNPHKTYENNSQETPESYEKFSHTKEREKKEKESALQSSGARNWSQKLSRRLYNLIQENNSDIKTPEPDWAKWESEIHNILSKYQCKPELLYDIIDWSLNEMFWKSKIDDPIKLTKHFMTLKQQMNAAGYENHSINPRFLPKQV